MYYLEDIIEKAASEDKFKKDLKESDLELFKSLHKQITKKKLPLTDKQYSLILEKIEDYRNLLLEGLDDLSVADLILMYPIRYIDRSRWVKFEKNEIKIRYVWNKKLISPLEKIRSYLLRRNKVNSTAVYKFTDESCFHIVNSLIDHEFEIDSALMERYKILKKMYAEPENYIPGIYNWEIKNLPKHAIDNMIADIGHPGPTNIHLYADRKLTYGLAHMDSNLQASDLMIEKIINRNDRFVFLDWASDESLSELRLLCKEICIALNYLKRSSVLVLDDFGFASSEDKNVNDTIENIFSTFFDGEFDFAGVGFAYPKQDSNTAILALNPITVGWFSKGYYGDLIICLNEKSAPVLNKGN